MRDHASKFAVWDETLTDHGGSIMEGHEFLGDCGSAGVWRCSQQGNRHKCCSSAHYGNDNKFPRAILISRIADADVPGVW